MLFIVLFRVIPLTLRGFSVVSISLFGFFIIGPSSSDLVASLISAVCLAVSLLFAVSVVILGIFLKKRINARVHFPQQHLFAQEPIHYGIALQRSSLPPYFFLNVSLNFRQSTMCANRLVVNGSSMQSSRRIFDSVTFPHRGVWHIDGLALTLGDSLGLFRMSWRLPAVQEIEVFPQEPFIKPLPIVAATTQSGDSLERSTDPSGDTFDLRPYSPSDGTRRLLWKVYAKSGNLMVRKPEPATIPEGEVCIFLIANPSEDHVAGSCCRYIRMLHEAEINTVVGTNTNPFPLNSELSTASAQKVVIQNVWLEPPDSGIEFANFLTRAQLKGCMPTQVVVFISSTNTCTQVLREVANRFAIMIVIVSVPTPDETKRGRQFPWGFLPFLARTTAPNNIPSPANSPDVIALEFAKRV